MQSRKISRSVLFGRIALFAFVLLAIAYYFCFASSLSISSEVLQLAVNQHDHDIYLLNMDLVKSGDSLFEFANDKGIASIYVLLSSIFPFLVTPDMALMSFVFNVCVLILNFWLYGKISDRLGLGVFGRLSFFVNLSLLYFAQLINKDMLTIFVFQFCAYAGMRGWCWRVLLLIPIFAFVRIQLVVFILIFVFLVSTKKAGARFWVVYVSTSLFAAYMTANFPIIGEDSLEGGFSAYLIDLNGDFLIGYLLLNPLRLVQYVYDAYLSFFIFNESGAVDVAKLLRIPQLILLTMLSPHLYRLCTRWSRYSGTVARPLVIAVLAYACTWLMNPTVNARYVMLITPILVLLGLYVRSVRRHV